jgi:hypothetical protein
MDVQNERKGKIIMVCARKECTSRRTFFKGLAGAAVAGMLIDREIMPQGNSGAKREGLVAVCGLYCGACPMYLATHSDDEQKRKQLLQRFSSGSRKLTWEDIQCDGCLGNGRLASFCRKEAIRLCPADKSNVTRCSDCPDFPCSRIANFNNDGMLHHAEVLDNLRGIRIMGIKDWAKHEEERWRCLQCKAPIAWYDTQCSRCGAKRSERLFKLKQA